MLMIQREPKGIMTPGQDLVAAGYAGREGARRIGLIRETELLTWFSKEYLQQIQQNDEIQIDGISIPWQKYGATEWEEVGRGGIFTALWNLSGAYRLGFDIDLYKIPVKQETIEVCERYDLNPYRLLSSNCMVAASDHGWNLCEKLAADGIKASVIGKIQAGIKRQVRHGHIRGYMERPREDEIQKIIQEAAL